MLSKEEFIKIIDTLKDTDKGFDKACEHLQGLWFDMNEYRLKDLVLTLLEKCMGIKPDPKWGSVISWWVYEREYGTRRPEISLTDNGKITKTFYLDTAEKLYDYIIEHEVNHETNKDR